MYRDKKTNYSNTISLTDQEVTEIQNGTITGFNISTPSLFNIAISVTNLSKPFRIPITDQNGDFMGMSSYYLAKFDIPPGQYYSVRIYSKEEIATMYT
jgi:hypothetical protein